MRKITRILGVAGAILLITLLALGIGWHPGAGVSAASCSVSGVISNDTTWSPATCDPFVVTASVIVPSGVTLTIEAGTTVKFDKLKGLLVQGTLVARGTAANPITFTSNQATPAIGDWGNIHFTDSSNDATFDGSGNYVSGSVIQYAIVEYAGGTSGAVYIESSSPYIDHNTIRNNRATGIYALGGGALRVTNDTITGNTGGGIWAGGTATITISDNIVTGNTGGNTSGSWDGGGIYAHGGTATVSRNTITSNSAGNDGGGIYISFDTVATISNNTIVSNTARYGGGIYIYGSATISSNTIVSNTASSGGGINVDGSAVISDNTIIGNTATGKGGGIAGGGTISNNTITGNRASQEGGGIYAYSARTITSNTIVSNTASSGGGIYAYSARTMGDNDLYGNTIGSQRTPNDLYNGNPVGSADVDAKNNYWGTTDPSVIEDHIWHFPDDSSRGLVDYIPFRTSSIVLTLTPSPTATPTVTPTATATPTSTPTPTPTATPTPAPSIPNLSVVNIVTKEKAYPGDALTYLMILDNSGPTGITVTLTDTIPAGASYISGTVWGVAVYSDTINSILWSGVVPPGLSSLPSMSFSFRVRIDPDVSANAITNTLLVSDGSIIVASTARTEVWRRTFMPLLPRGSSEW